MGTDFALDRLRGSHGRTVLYYRWLSPTPDDEPVTPDASAEPEQPMPGELRWNAPLGEWVIVAPERQDRTFLPDADACPLCPTRPGGPPTELERASFEVAVFDNRFPALGGTASPIHPGGSPERRPAIGASEVVVYAPDHDATVADLAPEVAQRVIEVWQHRTSELGARPDIAYVYIFENRGEAIGVTLHHPHGQVYGYPFVPPVIRREVTMAMRHRAAAGGCLWCDQLQSELASGERIVADGGPWVAGVPFAARWPFEVHLVPRRHVGSLTDLTAEERAGLAHVLQTVVRRYDGLFGRLLPYVMAVHQAPSGGADLGYHLHLEFYPRHRTESRLKFVAGSEVGAGVFVADLRPEVMAARLRE